MMKFSQPVYTIGQIAVATGVPAATIRTWYARKVVTVGMKDHEISPEENGLPRYLSGYTAILIGVMYALTTGGASPAVAAKAAQKFTWSGTGKTPENEQHRNPGALFEGDDTETVLLLATGTQADGECEIVCMNNTDSWRTLGRAFGERFGQFHVLCLNELVETIMRRLEKMPLTLPLVQSEKARQKAKETA